MEHSNLHEAGMLLPMSITFKKGDMFVEPVDAIVNTVNCVGVMGKGVALEFKKRWPANYKFYKKACDSKELEPGKMLIFDNQELFPSDGPRYLVNFPTKSHWRSKSKLSYVDDGLDALVEKINEYNIRSIAIPPLGCGNGGLDWKEVKSLITSKLGNLESVNIVVFAPWSSDDEPEFSHANFPMTFERAILLKAIGDLEGYFDGALDRISLQKIAYFLQALGIKFNLRFSKNLHGPYSEKLRKSFLAFEKSGMIKGFVSGNREAHVTSSGYALADDFLSNSLSTNENVIDRLDKLIQGYESPYGLELLSSVHWLAHHENHHPVDKVIEAMQNWNENKRSSFSKDTIRVAYDRLREDNLLN